MIPLPLPKAGKLPNIVGVDSKGCEKVLPHQPNSFLFAPDGSIASQWYDGSKSQPIITPNFDKSNVAAESVMAVDAQGRWYRLVPEEDGGPKKQLVREANAVFWENMKSQLSHAYDDVESLDNCAFDFAVWARCTDGAGITTLKKATKEDLFPDDELVCEDVDVNGYDGIMVRQLVDGKLVTKCLAPSCGKVLEAVCDSNGLNPKWKVNPRRLGYLPIPPTVVATISSDGSTNVTLPQYPSNPPGDVYAVFQTVNQGGNAASSASLTLGPYKISGSESNASSGSLNFAQAWAKCDSANVVFTSTHGNAVVYTFTVSLIGYMF